MLRHTAHAPIYSVSLKATSRGSWGCSGSSPGSCSFLPASPTPIIPTMKSVSHLVFCIPLNFWGAPVRVQHLPGHACFQGSPCPLTQLLPIPRSSLLPPGDIPRPAQPQWSQGLYTLGKIIPNQKLISGIPHCLIGLFSLSLREHCPFFMTIASTVGQALCPGVRRSALSETSRGSGFFVLLWASLLVPESQSQTTSLVQKVMNEG